MTDALAQNKVSASFRDPSGFLFTREGELYRQVNTSYQENYDLLMSSGLYKALVDQNLLVPHEEVSDVKPETELAYKVIKPTRIPFVSYPYEWCFSQLQDAAMTTLNIQKIALNHGMSLKDASAYNIQFSKGQPIFIDTLSFEKYKEGKPWIAYRQFCQHFLAPLALMSHCDIRLSQLLRDYIDGIPLDLVSKLLPWGTRFAPALGMHLHLHATSQKRYASSGAGPGRRGRFSRLSFDGLIDSLETAAGKMTWKPMGTEWADYYQGTNYSESGFAHKKELVEDYLDRIKPKMLWDLGANTGEFSHLAESKGIYTVAFDIDPAAVEINYIEGVRHQEVGMLPLILDLTNPSPSIGWANSERDSVGARGPADAIMALALIHHLAISNNVPLERIAEYFAGLGNRLIIEFVPKNDSQVKRLLTSREDIFPDYTQEGFEKAFLPYFEIESFMPIEETKRSLYLMKSRKENPA